MHDTAFDEQLALQRFKFPDYYFDRSLLQTLAPPCIEVAVTLQGVSVSTMVTVSTRSSWSSSRTKASASQGSACRSRQKDPLELFSA